jgi:L-ascorbate metabolism protein UlaG (beta-lactamase superfamily)
VAPRHKRPTRDATGSDFLRLSAYCVPQVRLGRTRLIPQNSRRGPERLRYLDGLLEYLNLLLEEAGRNGRVTFREVMDVAARVPFSDDLVEIVSMRGRPRARARRDAKDRLSFDPRRLAIAFPDGRARRRPAFTVRAGVATPQLSRLLAALRTGARSRDIDALAREAALRGTGELIRGLLAGGILEVAAVDDRPAAHFAAGRGDSVTWLGHAALLLQCAGRTVWVDPVLPARIVWSEEECASLFSKDFADSQFFESYGPGLRQYSPHELPLPDAVCLTHQDSDHVDLGLLMTLPPRIPIIVPRAAPDRPWEIDLRELLLEVLGPDRRVVVLPHGKTHQLGKLAITAMPFRGEMPQTLPHSWNWYLFETPTSAVACLADSRLVEAEENALIGRLGRSRRPLTLFGGPPGDLVAYPGWREGPHSTTLYNGHRLYSWYAPLHGMFDHVQMTALSYAQLARLHREAGLRHYFPYKRATSGRFADASKAAVGFLIF